MLATLTEAGFKADIVALKTLLEDLNPDAKIALCAHTRPDGDAIGSCVALTSALRCAGYQVTPLLADGAAVPQAYRWMPLAESFVQARTVDAETAYDLFIALDTPTTLRLGEAKEICQQAKLRVSIDHHPGRESYTDISLTATDAAATGQLIWELLPELGLKRSAEVALACYVALISDTGVFSFSNTDHRVLADAAEMAAAGADPARISRQLYMNKPLSALKLEELILSRISLHNEGAVVSSYYRSEDLKRLDVSSDWTENLIDLIRVVQGAQVAVLLVEGVQSARASLRSAGDFDVSVVARRFGGGGHHAAAGITWPDRNARCDDMLAQLLPLLPTGPAQ